MFSVAERPQPGTLHFACSDFDRTRRYPCTSQGPTAPAMVQGGWQVGSHT